MNASSIVVYTAITKGYDNLNRPWPLWQKEAAFTAFLETPQPTRGWEIRPIYRRFQDPCRNAKIHKILSHKYFPDAEYSIWIDGSIKVTSELPVSEWIKLYLQNCDLAVYRHRLRNCLYQEAHACISGGLDEPRVIHRQMEKYSDEGYPPNNGLAECTILFRRHSRAVQKFNEAWYHEITTGSRRDQLSFNYVARKLGLNFNYLPKSLWKNPHFLWKTRHKIPRSRPAGGKDAGLSETKSNAVNPSTPTSMNMVFLYYDNPNMLKEQIKCWNSYVGVLKRLPTILLVDDGSPRSRAVDIVHKSKCHIPIKVFRIQEDIPWNFTGARNLACQHAKGWIYMSDIDTLLLSTDAQKLFEARRLDKSHYYMPKRVWYPDLVEAKPGIVNLMFHKDKFTEIGGYDEDYAGNYGKEEVDFMNRLTTVAPKVYRDDVLIRVIPPEIVDDARTKGRLRDRTINNALYLRKEAAGFVNPVNPLRFSWQQVL